MESTYQTASSSRTTTITYAHLSSASVVTDSSGNLLSENRYTPFGEVRDITGSLDPITETDFGYTSQRDLDSIDLMDYNARFYSPLLGRFIQPDTLVPSLRIPQGLDRYSYTSNNPINRIDPTGHVEEGSDAGSRCSPRLPCWLRSKENYIADIEIHFEVEFTGEWRSIDEKYEVAKGIEDIGNRLKEEWGYNSAAEAFTHVYLPIELRWMDDVCEFNINGNLETCARDAFLGPGVIRFWDRYFGFADLDGDGEEERFEKETTIDSETAVHELGHVFGQLTDRQFENALDIAGVDDRDGFSLSKSNSTHQNEISADWFLNFVYGAFQGVDADDLQSALDDDWAQLIDLAANYEE